MRKTSLKQILLLLVILLPAFWCNANSIYDGYSAIQVKEASVQHTPKGSSIQAYIDGHNLTIVFTENLGHDSYLGLGVDYLANNYYVDDEYPIYWTITPVDTLFSYNHFHSFYHRLNVRFGTPSSGDNPTPQD